MYPFRLWPMFYKRRFHSSWYFYDSKCNHIIGDLYFICSRNLLQKSIKRKHDFVVTSSSASHKYLIYQGSTRNFGFANEPTSWMTFIIQWQNTFWSPRIKQRKCFAKFPWHRSLHSEVKKESTIVNHRKYLKVNLH